jgi:hypothetical protein
MPRPPSEREIRLYFFTTDEAVGMVRCTKCWFFARARAVGGVKYGRRLMVPPHAIGVLKRQFKIWRHRNER